MTAVASSSRLVSPTAKKRQLRATEWLSVAEVAEIMNASISTTSRMASAGVFEGAIKGCNGKRNSPWRIPRKSVDNLLEERGA